MTKTNIFLRFYFGKYILLVPHHLVKETFNFKQEKFPGAVNLDEIVGKFTELKEQKNLSVAIILSNGMTITSSVIPELEERESIPDFIPELLDKKLRSLGFTSLGFEKESIYMIFAPEGKES